MRIRDRFWLGMALLPGCLLGVTLCFAVPVKAGMAEESVQTVSDDVTYPEIGVQEQEMSFLYDKEQGLMRFDADGRELLTANIPNGAVSAMPVYQKAADGVMQTIYRNGEYIASSEDGVYAESGFYRCIQTVYPEIENGIGEDTSIITTSFCFWIADEKETCANVVGAPEGFLLERVYYQGIEQEVPKSGYYFLQGEGKYEFCFALAEDAGLSYTLELNRDTTAPFLDFDRNIEDGTATAPFSITSEEASCSYQVTRNGMKYDYVEGESLKTAGYYEVVVSDEYGNGRKYTFLLEADYEFFSPGMILLLASMAAVLLIALYRTGHDFTVV